MDSPFRSTPQVRAQHFNLYSFLTFLRLSSAKLFLQFPIARMISSLLRISFAPSRTVAFPKILKTSLQPMYRYRAKDLPNRMYFLGSCSSHPTRILTRVISTRMDTIAVASTRKNAKLAKLLSSSMEFRKFSRQRRMLRSTVASLRPTTRMLSSI